MLIKAAVLQALRTALRADFQKALTDTPTDFEKIATIVPSTTASNAYGWLGQFPGLREWIGDRVIKDMKENGYTIANKLYESTVAVKRTDIEDDNLGIYRPLASEQGRAAKVYPDEHTFALLKAGESTLCYDGQNFFDTDHPVAANTDGTGAVTTVSNIQAGAGTGPAWYLLDTSRALKPLIFQQRVVPQLDFIDDTQNEQVFMKDHVLFGIRARSAVGFGFWQMAYMSRQPLTSENLSAAYAAMRSLKGDGGRPLGIQPTTLVVPPTLREAANKIVVSDIVDGDSNPNKGLIKTIIDSAWLA